MSSRSTFSGIMAEARRAEKQRQAEIHRAAVAKAKSERAEARARAQADKAARNQYILDCTEQANQQNAALAATIAALGSVLEDALAIDSTITFKSLRNDANFEAFVLPAELVAAPTPPRNGALSIREPDALMKLIPGWRERHEKVIREAHYAFAVASQQHQRILEERSSKIKQLEDSYAARKHEYECEQQQHNAEIERLENAYANGDADAVVAYCTMVLEESVYPDGFPRDYRIAYLPDSKQLVVEYQLPNKEIVPAVGEYKYNKTKDCIDEKPRKQAEVRSTYQDVVAAVCLRTIHEILEADQGKHLSVVVFSGYVDEIDPATGKSIRPFLISVRTTKEKFLEIDLSKIDKKACLRNLGAQLSPQPAELQAVKPVVEFDMVDKRFVEDSDVLSQLESRPNLMDLSPWDFENLVNNLFSKIGFEAKLTQSSKDGGVDVVAFDPRPILGGKVVIQAKRYKNVVGVSAVRDLYGTMINEGAGKGILVTTSHYGPDAYDFAKDKPIELIDGGGLLYLLQQNGTEARIVLPEDGAG